MLNVNQITDPAATPLSQPREQLPLRGPFDNRELARQHGRGKAELKRAAQRELAALNLMTQAQMASFHAAQPKAETGSPPPEPANNVTKPLFGRKRGTPAPAPIPGGMALEEAEAAIREGGKIFAAAMRG